MNIVPETRIPDFQICSPPTTDFKGPVDMWDLGKMRSTTLFSYGSWSDEPFIASQYNTEHQSAAPAF